MGSNEKDMLWIGIALLVWVAYQSITGKFIYKRKTARRVEHPRAFWFAMTFEGLLAIACLGYGFGWTVLPMVCAGLVEVTALGFYIWMIGSAVRRLVKYPISIFLHLREGRPQEAAQELRSFLARRPGDRETRYLLAQAYEKSGEPGTAWDIYTELAQTEDGWGRSARIFLRKHSNESRVKKQNEASLSK